MKKKILVTSALPYVNNVPHLGNLVCVISADVYTRFLRLKGETVISILGTDEHGTTTETKALEEGLTPRQVCDKYYKIHKEIYEWFNNDFDCFGRTSSPDNYEVATDIFLKLDANGYILEDELEQSYCNQCQKFLADRFIEGTCPYCDYPHARGDQCEKCGKLLNATELKNARCKVCGTEPKIKSSKHLFIDLPKMEPELRDWIETRKKNWSVNARTMTEGWLKEGIKPRCITRDLKWGIAVPKKGYEHKVFYSWFDAPIGYIGITKETKKDWYDLWHNDKEVRLVQFMGKDNIPFHTILFPAFLIGTQDNYTLLDSINVNEYLNYEGGMFSKSRGTGVFGDDAISTGIPADIWRYYLMINRPEKTDTEFSWDDFQTKLNNELVANIGNLINRTVTFSNRFYDSRVPTGRIDTEFLKLIHETELKIGEQYEAIELKEALKEIMKLSKSGNQFFQENEPWKLVKEDHKKGEIVISTLLLLVRDLAILIQPFMPHISERILTQLNVKTCNWKDLQKPLKQGHQINSAEILFIKLEDEQKEMLKQKFLGQKKEKTFPLDLRVARIINIEDHPEAERLYVLQIDLGTEKRQLVAGLRPYYPKEELIDRNIVVVCNLEPAVLRGKKSEGMLLAGDDAAEKEVKLLEIKNSSTGEQVIPGKMKFSNKQLSIKQFAEIKLEIKNHKVFFEETPLSTSTEEVNVEIGDGAKVR